MSKFKVNPNAYQSGCLQGYFKTSYAKLVEKFGEPLPETDDSNDPYEPKVSTTWIFESEGEIVFDLYDWKETDLYDSRLMTIDEFRALPEYNWHIGGNSNPENFIEFVAFLKSSLGE